MLGLGYARELPRVERLIHWPAAAPKLDAACFDSPGLSHFANFRNARNRPCTLVSLKRPRGL